MIDDENAWANYPGFVTLSTTEEDVQVWFTHDLWGDFIYQPAGANAALKYTPHAGI